MIDRHPTVRIAAFIAFAAALVWTASASSQTLPTPDEAARTEFTPKWEAGIAAAAARFADYPASDEYRNFALPVPYFVYYGRILRSDDEGSRLRQRIAPDIEINVSGDGALSQHSSEARAGMPDLDYLVELGPSLRLTFAHVVPRAKLLLDLPVRAALSFGSGVHWQGLVTEPELTLRSDRLFNKRLTLQTSFSAKFTSAQLQQFFYEVQPQYATATRPAYAASSGYLGSSFGGSATYAFTKRVNGFVAARYYNYSGAASQDSPLFRDQQGYSVGVGFSWSFIQSRQRAED